MKNCCVLKRTSPAHAKGSREFLVKSAEKKNEGENLTLLLVRKQQIVIRSAEKRNLSGIKAKKNIQFKNIPSRGKLRVKRETCADKQNFLLLRLPQPVSPRVLRSSLINI